MLQSQVIGRYQSIYDAFAKEESHTGKQAVSWVKCKAVPSTGSKSCYKYSGSLYVLLHQKDFSICTMKLMKLMKQIKMTLMKVITVSFISFISFYTFMVQNKGTSLICTSAASLRCHYIWLPPINVTHNIDMTLNPTFIMHYRIEWINFPDFLFVLIRTITIEG